VLLDPNERRTYNIPYRTLIPARCGQPYRRRPVHLLHHVAESTIRAIYACMLTGQAAGTAASLSIGTAGARKR
jgi:hypothetical protein